MLRTLALALVACGSAAAQTLRIDPPNWWVGTTYSRVELLVASDAPIATVHVQGAGVTVVSDEPAKNPNYHYVTVELATRQQAGDGGGCGPNSQRKSPR